MQAAIPMVALALTTLISAPALAGEPRTQADVTALLQSSYSRIDGRETPELIPYHVQMSAFFSFFSYYGVELKAKLGDRDFESLQRFAAGHGEFVKQDADAQLSSWKEIAARAEPMSAVEIATEMKQATTRIEEIMSNRYRSVLRSLSDEGCEAVNRFVHDRVQPSASIEDPLVVAEAAPVFYKQQILGVYKLMQEGKWPPPLPDSDKPTQTPGKSADGQEGRIGTDRGAPLEKH